MVTRKHDTPEEAQRRRALVAMHVESGYTRDTIALALGVAQGKVTKDIAVLGLKPLGRRRGPIPADQCRWREGDTPYSKVARPKIPKVKGPAIPEVEDHARVNHLRLIEQFNEEAPIRRTAKAFAFRAGEARDKGDDEWLAEQATTIEVAMHTLRLMHDALHDEAARQRLQGARDGAPHLSVVNDD